MSTTAPFIANPPYNVVQPGAYSAVNASLVTSPNPGPAAPIPAILGTTLGGKPDTALYFDSPGQLAQVCKGGPGYDTARFAFDGGAQTVAVVRVGNGITQASLALSGASGTVVTLTAQDWGSWANSILITVTNTPTITLQYTDALGTVYTEQWNLSSIDGLTPELIASAINGQVYGFTASNYVVASVGTGSLPLATISNHPLAGGTDGLTPAAGDWTNGLTALETEDVSVIVPATSDATVHAQVIAHCVAMSAPAARKERTAQMGGALGESVSQTLARQAALLSARGSVNYPGFYDYNAQGNLTEYDPFYLAGKIAGMRCALPDVATSLVHASVPIIQAEVDLSTVQGGPIDQLLMGGVTPVAKQPGGGYWIVDDLTGYNAADKVFLDVNSVRSADYVAQYLRTNLEALYVGGKGGITVTQASLKQSATKLLDDLVTNQIIVSYLTPTVNPGPGLYAFSVVAPVQLVNTTKFIFITEQLQPTATTTGSTTTADLT